MKASLLKKLDILHDRFEELTALLGDAERAGATLAVRSPLCSGSLERAGVVLESGGAESLRFRAALVINAAGPWAADVAASLAGFPAALLPPRHHAKGSYYALAGRSPFSRLVYPLPEVGGLGVHLTLDLGGQARFGPDLEWLPEPAQPESSVWSAPRSTRPRAIPSTS